ncbi:MAG TPA: Flp family type IVb pilin [Streptosporangiaceae bacterium]|nr:Flp family type IVb pilin [Streptosporangiaceae bacterium]
MLRVIAFLHNFLAEPVRRDDRGVTAVEYAVLLVMIAALAAGAIAAFGTALGGAFTNLAQHL